MKKEDQILEFMRIHSNVEIGARLYYKFKKDKYKKNTAKEMLKKALEEENAFIKEYIKL